ncbi:hypothetical protein [Streptomyces sp. NPDC088785]|uniref:hypothetical protein n=1 Tax=Streptomyces sp. NPDC088785 TaxID=3365897 RepID=UPI00380DAFF0
MPVRIPLVVLAAAALATGSAVAAHADDGIPQTTQYCRIVSLTADGGPQETVTSVPRPLSAAECREQGGSVTDTPPVAFGNSDLDTDGWADPTDTAFPTATGFTMTP